MWTYKLEGPDFDGSIGDLIRKYGPADSEARLRATLLEVMDPDDVSQLTITASPGSRPETFDVAIEGPPKLVRTATAALRKTSR